MRSLNSRLADLERKMAPPDKYRIYQESLEDGEEGMFLRYNPKGDETLLTHDELLADAAAAGAVAITIVYESTPIDAQPGLLADLVVDADLTTIYMPDNGRGDL